MSSTTEWTHRCMDCGKNWMTPWRSCDCGGVRFEYIGPGAESLKRWMAKESGLEYAAWKKKFGYK